MHGHIRLNILVLKITVQISLLWQDLSVVLNGPKLTL